MNEVATIEPGEVAETLPTPVTPMEMIGQAVQSGTDIAVIERLMDLQERWEANQGRKAFDAAIAAAKAEIPTITKNREVDFTSQKGRTHYRHEDLAEIKRVVDPILSEHGLSYRYRTAQESATVTVTCVLSHRDGYSEETTLTSGSDQSGNKNHLQAVGSAVTYLQRYTLKAALGLAVSDDDDGALAGSGERITPDQFIALRDKIDEAEADQDALCAHFKVELLEELPRKFFGQADAMLDAKIAKAAKAQADA